MISLPDQSWKAGVLCKSNMRLALSSAPNMTGNVKSKSANAVHSNMPAKS